MPDNVINLVVRHDGLTPQDLCGEWRGYYEGNCDQVIRIGRIAPLLIAVKVTGDSHVEAKRITWYAILEEAEFYPGDVFKGYGTIADPEGHNLRCIDGKLIIISPERIIFEWTGSLGDVEYRKDD